MHAIGKCRVEHLCEKLVSGVLLSGDERGQHKNRPHATSEDLKAQIREHISSFPGRESHCLKLYKYCKNASPIFGKI